MTMNGQSTTTTEEVFEANLCDCTSCLLVPLSVLGLEIDKPLGGWDAIFEREGIKVIDDHIGRKSISALSARRLVAARRRQAELFAEDATRRTEALARKHPMPGRGVPAIAGASPYESMIAIGLEPSSIELRLSNSLHSAVQRGPARSPATGTDRPSR